MKTWGRYPTRGALIELCIVVSNVSLIRSLICIFFNLIEFFVSEISYFRGAMLRLSILFPLVHVFCLLSLVYLRSLRFMVLRKVKLTLSWPKFSRPLILRRRGSVSSVLKSSRIPSRVFLLCGSDM